MTFYEFVQQRLDSHCVEYRETESFWVYRFDRKEYPYNVAFPKYNAENFLYYYGRAIRALALILDESYLHGLAIMAHLYDKENEMNELKIKVLDPVCKPTRSGNWIDCYSREEIHYEAGEAKRIPLGFCISVGPGKEMLLAARSSFFGKTGGIQTNAPGVIDEEYCGDEDEVLFSVYFTRPGVIYKGQKIAQFRIIDKMPEVKFEYVEKMNTPSRGGFGSTGN